MAVASGANSGEGARAAIAAARRCLGEAEAALRAADLPAAEEACRTGLATRPSSVDLHLKLGEVLAAAARVEEALIPLQAAREIAPGRPDGARLLSACLHDLGREDEARAVAQAFFAAHPYRPPEDGPRDGQAPTILRVRGLERASFTLGRLRNGEVEIGFNGGHFSLQYLINWSSWRVLTGYVVGDNWIAKPPTSAVRLLVNTIADPDREGAALTGLAHFAQAHPDMAIINQPDRVLRTGRQETAALVAARDGFVAPKIVRIPVAGRTVAGSLEALDAADIGYPAIFRETGTQTARTVELIADRDAAARYLAGVSTPEIYAIPFIENADAEGWYTKRRLFFIDGVPYPVVTHTDKVWNVHGGNRRTVMAQYDWMLRREQDFLRDPKAALGADAYAALSKLPEATGLDFFGIDFTLLPDGRILFFEMNAAMRHSFDHAKRFAYMKPHMQQISDAFDSMCRRRAGVV
jgi:hypothetical protein